jgi:hypothetical protein
MSISRIAMFIKEYDFFEGKTVGKSPLQILLNIKNLTNLQKERVRNSQGKENGKGKTKTN